MLAAGPLLVGLRGEWLALPADHPLRLTWKGRLAAGAGGVILVMDGAGPLTSRDR